MLGDNLEEVNNSKNTEEPTEGAGQETSKELPGLRPHQERGLTKQRAWSLLSEHIKRTYKLRGMHKMHTVTDCQAAAVVGHEQVSPYQEVVSHWP